MKKLTKEMAEIIKNECEQYIGLTKKLLDEQDRDCSYVDEYALSNHNDWFKTPISQQMSLLDKMRFYVLSYPFAQIIKEIVSSFGATAYLSVFSPESMYVEWKNRADFDVYNRISSMIKPNEVYSIHIPEDNSVIDLVVESNFYYFSNIRLYIASEKLLLEPTCHGEVFLYSPNIESLKYKIQDILSVFRQNYSRTNLVHKEQDIELYKITW